ncbi:MAG: NTP transferase domain-containing protein [Campylobacterales bacterium]|nr:NTP transferase domain-containing protein [Campylobacterales bacterium]
MKAIVLAGGFGTRIQPLTNSVPKPMLPILNRPMMEHTIIKLRDELGITEIAVLLFFKPDVIKNHFGDGRALGVNITYVLPDDDYGTAGAVAFAREFLDETFIIVSGDLVTNFNFADVKKFHEAKESKLTITLTSVENPLAFGVVIADENSEIKKFLEKPSWGEVFSDTINTGIYMIEPEILEYIPYGTNFDFAKDLFPLLMKKGISLWGCSMKGYWRDVGNPESYRDVYHDIFSGEVEMLCKGEKKEIDKGVVYCEEGVELDDKIRVKGTVILGKNVKIAKGVTLSNCCIGDNTKIKEHAEIIDTVIWQDVQIGTKVKLKNSIICNDNVLKSDVKAPFGVIIAEKCKINKKVAFERDIIVWPDKVIEESSVVSTNIIWGDKYKSSIFENGMVTGRTNIELSAQMSTKLAEAFGSIFPVGSKIYVSRDYHKSSRMLKRAFLSGILSTGVNAVDVFDVPSNVMRHSLSKNEDIVAGVHFRQSVLDSQDTEIIFYTSEGLEIDTKVAQSIERIFFRENFRRVSFNEIGELYESPRMKEEYIRDIEEKAESQFFRNNDVKIAVDIMNGSVSDVYPEIVSTLGINNIILNGHKFDSGNKLGNFSSSKIIKSQHDVESIVKSLKLDYGFLIYPNGHKLQMVDNRGRLVYDYILLLVVLELLDKTAEREMKVLLPAWAPDFTSYKNLKISKDKWSNFKASQLREYDLIADTDGFFTFTEFNLNRDAVFAHIKILELIQKSGLSVSKIIDGLPEHCYRGGNIHCPSQKKGKMMRKFLEDGNDKEVSSIDGVQIRLNENEWILMVPDQYKEYLNIYVQAEDEKSAGKIFYQYQDKIEKWISE